MGSYELESNVRSDSGDGGFENLNTTRYGCITNTGWRKSSHDRYSVSIGSSAFFADHSRRTSMCPVYLSGNGSAMSPKKKLIRTYDLGVLSCDVGADGVFRKDRFAQHFVVCFIA